MRDWLLVTSRWLAWSGSALMLVACTIGGGVIVSTVPERTPTPSMAIVPTLPSGDIAPVSISKPSPGAKDAFARCHVGDQYSVEQVAGMGQIASTNDLFHYVSLTGREREFKADVPAWVIQFRGDIPMWSGFWTDPVCIVTPDYFGYYATGPSKDWNGAQVATPEPPPTPPDRSLPPLLP